MKVTKPATTWRGFPVTTVNGTPTVANDSLSSASDPSKNQFRLGDDDLPF